MMRRIARALLFVVLAVAAIAQNSTQLESDEVKRVGARLKCQCGCNDNLNCNMSSGQCHFCKPARSEIYKMQREGKSDATIIDTFIKQYGEVMRLNDPNSYFWLVPYVLLGLGGVLVVWVVKRLRGPHTNALTPAAAGGAPVPDDDPDYARYRAAIERDTEKLD